MAYNSQFQMTLQDRDGNYYVATQELSAAWTVTTTTTKTYLASLPQDWQSINIEWNRHPEYLGVFRSQSSNGAFKFSVDARAIIQHIRRTYGIRGYGNLKIWIWNETTFDYDVWYSTLLDFRTYLDKQQTQMLEISTLDSELIQQIQARGNTKFKIPFWTYDDGLGDWLTDAEFGVHEGIKLLYNATFISSATEDNPLIYAQVNDRELLGFNHGRHGTAPNDGFHTLPFLSPYTPVQKDGSTTYVGNTILTPFLITGNQANGSNPPPTGGAGGANEIDFNGTNNSQPYTRNSFSLKNILPTGSGSIDMSMQVQATIPGTMEITGAAPSTNPFLGFVVFEIDSQDEPVFVAGEYSYTPIYKWYLTGASTPGGTISEVINMTLSYNKVYVFGLVFDDDAGISQGTQLNLEFTDLRFSILSNYDGGASGTPVVGPSFPASVFMGYRLWQVLRKIVPMLATTRSDDWGFPVPVTTPYSGLSSYLQDDAATPVADVIPFNILLTSSYSLQNLQGRSYMAISFNELFNFCKNVAGCAGGIDGDVFRIENFAYFFDASTMVLDLGYDVTEFEIQQMTEGIGAQLKAGMNKSDTNSNFGIDEFNTELNFDTPAVAVPGTMDIQETAIVCGMYEAEFVRQQQVTQQVTPAYDAGKPSANDKVVAFYMESEQTFELPTMVNGKLVQVYDPANNPLGVFAYGIKKYTNAQSTDPTAATAPYVAGLYYPDTAINIPLSPCRSLYRNGPIIRSVLSNMDAEYLTFRNNTVIQANNEPFTPVGMSSNLNVGASAAPYVEFADQLIGSLPASLFSDSILRVRSKYPVNMYQLFGNGPRGYVRFVWKDTGYTEAEYKMFIYKAIQVADGSATEFYGWKLP